MRKRTMVRLITFLAAAALVAGGLAFTENRRARGLELYARASTQRAFDELVTNVTEMSNALEKSVYVTDPALESALCTQIFGRAASAQMAMSALPWSSQELERVSGFLSRVGDYACTLSRTVGGSGGYSREEQDNLSQLSETAGVMRLNLQDMQARIMAGKLTMDEVYGAAERLEAREGGAPMAGSAFQRVEAEFPELPSLIYDGPFSERMLDPRPRFLEGKSQVTEEQARQTAAAFLGVREDELVLQGEVKGTIPCRSFSAETAAGEYTVYVTDSGGAVLSALCSRLPGREKISAEECVSRADSFMSRLGVAGMRESYHMAQDGVVTVNYEFVQDGVLCYPDLIKVGVAMDTGALMSYDARGYISCHGIRTLPEEKITERQARDTISPALTAGEHRMALIPSPGGEERLCHEFSCTAGDDRRYLVYVNAVTGAQEKILILLEDGAGTLTV